MMKETIHFTTCSFNGSIPLKYGSTTTPLIIAHCQNSDVMQAMLGFVCHVANKKLQYQMHP